MGGECNVRRTGAGLMRPMLTGIVVLVCVTHAGCQHDGGALRQGAATTGRPKAVFPELRFDFGEVPAGTVVQHDFAVGNEGNTGLTIRKIDMSTPLLVTGMPRRVEPGTQGKIQFKLDTAGLAGKFEGGIAVFLDDAARPRTDLMFTGRITPPIEISPMSAFFVAGQRGHGGRNAIEIVNHQSAPLRIEKIEHTTDRFTTQLETVEAGQRYRLSLALKPGGPVGKSAEKIVLSTSSKQMPSVTIVANTYLYERVHTFPDEVALGTLSPSEINDVGLTLMIYQEGGRDFHVKVSSDLPGLNVKSERGAMGDRYQAKITLVANKIPRGAIKGSIFVDTDDPQFRRLVVPVSGQVADR